MQQQNISRTYIVFHWTSAVEPITSLALNAKQPVACYANRETEQQNRNWPNDWLKFHWIRTRHNKHVTRGSLFRILERRNAVLPMLKIQRNKGELEGSEDYGRQGAGTFWQRRDAPICAHHMARASVGNEHVASRVQNRSSFPCSVGIRWQFRKTKRNWNSPSFSFRWIPVPSPGGYF